MGSNSLWWFEHRWPDARNADASFYNSMEADMIVCFVQYLVQNGVMPQHITILTYYKGQVNRIHEILRKNRYLRGRSVRDWSVRTVDGFQGEENEIILLSLVRSPGERKERSKAGFVEDENRAAVATSRARCGLYIFGDSWNILNGSAQSNKTWQKVYEVFVQQNCVGPKLPITCQNHQEVTELGSRMLGSWSLAVVALVYVTEIVPKDMHAREDVTLLIMAASSAKSHAKILYAAVTSVPTSVVTGVRAHRIVVSSRSLSFRSRRHEPHSLLGGIEVVRRLGFMARNKSHGSPSRNCREGHLLTQPLRQLHMV